MVQLRDNTCSTLTDAQIDLDEKLQTDNLVLVDDLVVVFFFYEIHVVDLHVFTSRCLIMSIL